MTSLLRSIASGRRISALLLATALTTTASAQTNSFNTGTLLNVGALSPATTTGSTMGGMLVTWTFASGLAFSSNWRDIGGGLWGVSSGGFSVELGADVNTFGGLWSIKNRTNSNISSVRFNGAPGNTVFDCQNGAGCTPDTPGSNQGFSLTTASLSFQTTATGIYSNAVGVGGNPGVGDLYEQLTISFANGTMPTNQFYDFFADTDNYLSATVVPEPGTWALTLVGLTAVGVASRRRRTRR